MAAPVPAQGLGDLAATDFAAARSPERKAWIADVPALLARLARQWDLTIDSERFRHGYSAVVLPVGQRGRPLVLKLAWPPGRVRGEAGALAAWRARGAVELVARDVPRGALLLERLDASRSLASIPLAEAAAVAGALMRTLAVETPGSFPLLQTTARELAATFPARQRALAHQVPGRWDHPGDQARRGLGPGSRTLAGPY
jgi:streptomycin 6-kinase